MTTYTQEAEQTLSSSITTSLSVGYRIYVKYDCELISITKNGDCTATTAVLLDDDGDIIDSASFSSNTATFSSPIELDKKTYYRIEVNSGGSNYSRRRNSSPSYPYTNEIINFTAASVSGETHTDNASNILSISVGSDFEETAGGVLKVYKGGWVTGNTKIYASIPEFSQNAEASYPSSIATSLSRGYRIYVNTACFLKSITMDSSCTATTAVLLDDDGDIIDSASFTGYVATFSNPILLNASTYYRIEVNKDGNSYSNRRNTSPSYAYNNTYIDFVSSSSEGAGTDKSSAYNILSIIVSTGSWTAKNIKRFDGYMWLDIN